MSLATPEALHAVLKALLEGKEVASTGDLSLYTTRPANTISALRNEYHLKIKTKRVKTDSGKWYGTYILEHIGDNLDRAKKCLKMFAEMVKSRQKPLTS